jgi:hypothetical protein
MTSDPEVDEELILVDQIEPVQLDRELATTEEHTGWGYILDFCYSAAMHSISTRLSPLKLMPMAVRAGLFTGKYSA